MQMTLPAYVVPTTTVTWMSGNPLPPQYLCSQADAQLVAKETGGVLSNGVDFFKSFGIIFVGVNPTDALQPWVITLNGSTNFAGPSIVQMYAANSINGGGIGNQGSFQNENGQWNWVPVAPAPAPPTSTTVANTPELIYQMMTGSGSPIEQQILQILEQILAKVNA